MPETIAHYQLLESIGSGTLGLLHRARDLEHGRTVALRIVHPDIADDPVRCAVLLADVQCLTIPLHTGIAAVYECVVVDGRACIASEFVPGQKLSAMVAGSPLNARRAVELAAQIADALAAAHGAALAHGALDAASIIVTPKGVPKVLDVGMVEWTRAGADAREDDRAGLASVLFEMLLGRPLKRGWPAEFRLAAIPVSVQPILRKLAATGQEESYGSMAVAAAALRDAAASLESVRADAPMPVPVSAARPTTSPMRVPAMVAAVALLAAALWWLLTSS